MAVSTSAKRRRLSFCIVGPPLVLRYGLAATRCGAADGPVVESICARTTATAASAAAVVTASGGGGHECGQRLQLGGVQARAEVRRHERLRVAVGDVVARLDDALEVVL
jgi:hypothetical protein